MRAPLALAWVLGFTLTAACSDEGPGPADAAAVDARANDAAPLAGQDAAPARDATAMMDAAEVAPDAPATMDAAEVNEDAAPAPDAVAPAPDAAAPDAAAPAADAAAPDAAAPDAVAPAPDAAAPDAAEPAPDAAVIAPDAGVSAPDASAPDASAPPADGGVTVTFSDVWTTIISPRCSCHQFGSGGLVMNTESAAFNNLVGASAVGCAPETRVIPGDAANSLLYQKVAGVPACGSRMPLGGAPLSPLDVALIADWIQQGANP